MLQSISFQDRHFTDQHGLGTILEIEVARFILPCFFDVSNSMVSSTKFTSPCSPLFSASVCRPLPIVKLKAIFCAPVAPLVSLRRVLPMCVRKRDARRDGLASAIDDRAFFFV